MIAISQLCLAPSPSLALVRKKIEHMIVKHGDFTQFATHMAESSGSKSSIRRRPTSYVTFSCSTHAFSAARSLTFFLVKGRDYEDHAVHTPREGQYLRPHNDTTMNGNMECC